MDTLDRRQRIRRRRVAGFWLCALLLAGGLALTRRPDSTAALPDLPIVSIDAALTLPPGALVATADEAAEYGLRVISRWIGVEQARVVKVELVDLNSATAGYPDLDPAFPVWRVSFDSAVFPVPMCPAPPQDFPNPREYTCGYGDRAAVAFFASDGNWVGLTIGLPIYPPGTPLP